MEKIEMISVQQAETALTTRPTKRTAMIIGAVAFALWAYTGFMGPSALLNGTMASSECIKFAKEKDVFKNGDMIDAVNLRIRNGAWVYDLHAHAPGSKSLEARTCVVDGNSIRLLGLLEAGFWR
jgi:hypothetical protein